MDLKDLPIFPYLPEIAEALSGGSLVLSAETGAGKTSAVPVYLAKDGRARGKIVVLEPRRLAAVAAASRAAELTGTEPGDVFGYRIRGGSKVGRTTRVEFVTDAVFARMIQDDPLLSDYCLVAIDEFHERTAWADLGLAFAAEAREARGDLSVLLMSATMDAAAASAYLACPTLKVPGRTFPIATTYRPPKPAERLEEAVASAVVVALERSGGDVLAFLPGLREIDGTATALRATLGGSNTGQAGPIEIRSLYGSMPLAEQRLVIAPAARSGRRVILATNVAETSLTVQGIGAVVDSGLSRFVRFHAPSGLDRLVTERVSVAEADQRRGRAGRTGPGVCVRCWDESDILPPSRGAELARVELSPFALECAVRGSAKLESTRWLEAPPRHSWEAALGTLRAAGLVQGDTATPMGKRATALGTGPRSGAALLRAASGSDASVLHAMAFAAAVLSEREPAEPDGDFRSGLELLLAHPTAMERRTRAAGGRSTMREAGPRDGGESRILAEADRLLARLENGFTEASDRLDGAPGARRYGALDLAAARRGIDRLGDTLAFGFPDRLARSLGDGVWEFASGRRARSAFDPSGDAWIVALDVDAGDPMGKIRSAAPVGGAAAAAALAGIAAEAIEVEWRGLSAAAWRRTKAGAFVLSERRLDRVPAEIISAAFASKLRAEGLSWLPWNDDARSIVDRARFYAARRPIAPDSVLRQERLEDAAILESIASAAGPWLAAMGPAIDENGLIDVLKEGLGREFVEAVEREVPAFVTTPGGKRRRPHYSKDGPARLAGRIQEFFGMADCPLACGEPMAIELLSPADRPLQVTSDLASFWRVAYPAIRPEMARRYPKHHWPVDPAAAVPGRGIKPR